MPSIATDAAEPVSLHVLVPTRTNSIAVRATGASPAPAKPISLSFRLQWRERHSSASPVSQPIHGSGHRSQNATPLMTSSTSATASSTPGPVGGFAGADGRSARARSGDLGRVAELREDRGHRAGGIVRLGARLGDVRADVGKQLGALRDRQVSRGALQLGQVLVEDGAHGEVGGHGRVPLSWKGTTTRPR